MAARARKKSRVINVDFTGVESGRRSIPDGTYPAVITSVEEKESSEGNPMLVIKWKTTGRKHDGVTIYDNLSLLPQALFRLKGLLEALGEESPKSATDVDLDDLEDKECLVVVVNEKYEGRDRPKVVEYASTEDKSDDEDEEEEEEETEEEEEEEEDDSDEDEKPRARKGGKGSSKKRASDDDEEDDEEEEEEDSRVSKKDPKLKEGQKVRFRDEKGKSLKGKITDIDGDTVQIEDSKGDTWEIDASEVEVF